MSGCDWQKKKFSVAIQVNVSQEEWDIIFDEYCKCKEFAICGLLDKQKRLQCANCGGIIKNGKI